MYKIYILFFSAWLLLLISCDAEVDTSGDLGGGYNFRADGGMMWINGQNVYDDGIPGNVTDYISDANHIIAIQEPSKKFYHYFFKEKLISRYYYLLYNREVSDNPNELHKRFKNSKWWSDTTLKSKISRYITIDNNRDHDAEISHIVDSVVTHDPEYKKIFSSKTNYWIIVKRDNRVYGPLTKEQYFVKRGELRIPKELQLGE